MASRMYKKCTICNTRRVPGSDVFLAALPLDPARCRLWVQAIGQEDLVHLPIEKLHTLKYVCAIHFTREDFNKQGNRLLQSAVPMCHLPLPPLPEAVFVDFPLHVGWEKEKHQSGVLRDSTNLIKKTIQHQRTCHEEHLTAAGVLRDSTNLIKKTIQHQRTCHEEHLTAAVSECYSSSSGPVVVEEMLEKTSIDPKYGKRKFDDIDVGVSPGEPQPSTSSAPEEILVQSYKRKRKNEENREKTTKEKVLLARLKKAKLSLRALAKTSINIDELDSTFLKNFLSDFIKNQKKAPRGKRWDMRNKISALAIFKRSPRTYRFLQKQMSLPSEKTLHRLLRSIPMEPGLNLGIIEMLKNKTKEMGEKDRYCTLLFDEIALKKRLLYNESTDKVEGYVDYGPGENMGRNCFIADHALVFMLQGIGKKIKQPLAYYFVKGTVSSEKLAVIIKKLILSLDEVGITILTTVCDQGPTNIGALNLLKKMSRLEPDDNFFFVEEKKVFILYDIPHLFKSIRNNFYQAGQIAYDGKIAQWRHLIEAEERNRNFLNFKKLNSTVVNPTYRIKMKVKYAAHALSNTMAAVIKMLAWSKEDPEKQNLNDTAYVIEELDRLFDVTNGPSTPKDKKKGIRENVSEKTKHVESWDNYREKIATIKFLKSHTRVPLQNVRCIKGYLITLKSLKDIWWNLKSHGFKYLNLRQLNQDSLENLFGTIRQHSPTNKNPTCSHFTAALKSSVISGLTASHNRGSNCDEDNSKLLFNFQDLLADNKSQTANAAIAACSTSRLHVEVTDYPIISIPEPPEELYEIENDLLSFDDQPVVYVSGYIACKLLHKSACSVCEACLKNNNPVGDEGIYKYISLREWWKEKTSLTYPTKKLCDTINKAKNVFETNIVHCLHRENICNLTVLEFVVHCDMAWLVCPEHSEHVKKVLLNTIAKLFIRQQCKIVNNNFKKSESDNADLCKKAQQQSKEK